MFYTTSTMKILEMYVIIISESIVYILIDYFMK